MSRVIECVPNFSEGRNPEVINAIAREIESVSGVKLLDIDQGYAANRTVFTFAGEPEKVKEAAKRAIRKATELIDMTKHKGEHPRIGACDVVPFVPVTGVTMEECVQIAHEVGKWIADELGVPVYMYEEAATKPERKSLPNIRKGEYEGLPEKLKDPEWKPDYGEPVFNPKSGAYVVGAREFLIAYNVNLNTKDKKLANNIAKRIRENGYTVTNENGEKIQVPGLLPYVRAIGWYIDEYGIAQISINLVNYKKTPLWKVFETCVEEASKEGVRVTGSEIVGLVPKDALLETGRYYLKKQGKNTGIPEKEIIHIAIKSLGLNDVQRFEPEKKIIEYLIEDPQEKKLERMTIEEFVDELSSESPAPGGGSVSALSGALSAALVSMVA
ncbi:MAG: glutamate formimidoyltransferase, partial [candidate division WOR-3 bacterium]